MFTFFILLIVLVAILMCLIVLIQNSKGGGLASGFASSNQIMGVRKTADFLEKATWTLAAAMVVLSILAAHSLPTESRNSGTANLPEIPNANTNEQDLYYGGDMENFGSADNDATLEFTGAELNDEPIEE